MDVVATSGKPLLSLRESSLTGDLTLNSTPQEYRRAPNPDLEFPFYGHSTVNLKRLGPVSLAYSPSESTARRPGVQAMFSHADGQLHFVFGNAFTPDGMYTHAGVTFYVFAADSSGFRGWWLGGGLTQGYFCAWRVPTDA